jgi:hypothetical protein
MEDDTAAHRQHIDALLAVVFAFVDPLDREGIEECLDCFLEGDAMIGES